MTYLELFGWWLGIGVVCVVLAALYVWFTSKID